MLQDPSVHHLNPISSAGQPEVTSLDFPTTSRHLLQEDSHQTISLYCANCGEKRVVTLRCGRRSCPICRKSLHFRLLREYLTIARRVQHPKLLTLTRVTRKALTRQEVSAIRSAFQRLLHRQYFRERIHGGLYVIEIKSGGTGWNLHLHALIEASYLDQRIISNNWQQITGDSYVVDIRQAYSARTGLRYILKYMLKPPVLNGQESIYDQVLKGTRLVQPFGLFYHSEKEKLVLACPRCGRTDWMSEFELKERGESAGAISSGAWFVTNQGGSLNPPVV